MTSITPLEHSDLVGGSTAARRIACPPSYLLEKQVPKDDGGSIHARTGTLYHEVCAKVLQDNVEPQDILPFTYTSPHGWTQTLTQEEWNELGETALEMYDIFVAQTEERLGANFVYTVETRVAFPGVDGAFGTSDIIAYCDDEILICDWKFGQGVVDATDNMQLAFYACAALETIPEFFPFEITDNTKVTFVILQPAAGRPSIWQTDVAYLDDFARRLREAVALAKEGRGEVKAGDHCKFARCQAICPLRAGAAQVLADRLDKLNTLTTKGNTPMHDVIDIEAALAEILDLAALVKPMLESAEVVALNLLESGRNIQGYTLKPKRAGARKWVEDGQASEYLEKFLGDDAFKTAVISPAVAEKLLKKEGYDLPEDLVVAGESSGNNIVKAKNHSVSDSLFDVGVRVSRRLS